MNQSVGEAPRTLTTTKKVAAVMAVIGGIAPLLARAGNDAEIDAFILVDMGMNAAIWYGVVLLIGWVISKVRKPSPSVLVTPSPAASGVTPEQATSPAPGWHPDPYGRFAYRYWDGRWTSSVSSNGRTYDDAPE